MNISLFLEIFNLKLFYQNIHFLYHLFSNKELIIVWLIFVLFYYFRKFAFSEWWWNILYFCKPLIWGISLNKKTLSHDNINFCCLLASSFYLNFCNSTVVLLFILPTDKTCRINIVLKILLWQDLQWKIHNFSVITWFRSI